MSILGQTKLGGAARGGNNEERPKTPVNMEWQNGVFRRRNLEESGANEAGNGDDANSNMKKECLVSGIALLHFGHQ